MINIYPAVNPSNQVGSLVLGQPNGPPILGSLLKTGVLVPSSVFPALVAAESELYNEPFSPAASLQEIASFTAIGASPTIFVAAVSNGASILTTSVINQGSPTVWTARSPAFAGTPTPSGVLWNGTKFLAWSNGTSVAAGVKYIASLDGITWITTIGSQRNAGCNQIAYSNTIFVAVDSGGGIETSPVGSISFLTSVSGVTTALKSVCHNGTDLFVAVGGGGSDYATILTSPDGITWTKRANVLSTQTGIAYVLGSVIWDGTKFIAATTEATGCVVLTSTDGITWTRSASALPISGTLSYVSGKYIVQASGLLAQSTDFSNWTYKNGNGSSGYVVFNGKIYTRDVALTGIATVTTGYVGNTAPLTDSSTCSMYIKGA